MNGADAAKQCAAVARRGAKLWLASCRRNPAVALASAVAAGFLAGMVLRVFERRK